MNLKRLSPKAALNKSYQKIKPHRSEFQNFKTELKNFLDSINLEADEEYNKKPIANFLEKTFYSENNINTKENTDLAVYLGKSAKDKVGVIIEVKHPKNVSEMVKPNNINAKAMHEVILYYLNERIIGKNDEIKSIVITNLYEWFIFDAQIFERLFYKDSKLKKDYESWNNNKKVSSNTPHFYNEIAKPFLENLNAEIEFTYSNLKDYNLENEKNLIPLFKIFSPPHLIKETFINDSNTLNKPFYQELLHIIGLEEVKEGSKKIIRRKDEKIRDAGSLLENTIGILKSKDSEIYFNDKEKYGANKDEQLFNIALELNITWINRILFLKLLEAQLINYNKGDKSHKFLDSTIIKDFDIMHELFHEVLAVKEEERSKEILYQFKNVPYLNSSLFEISPLERKTLDISGLKDRFTIPYLSSTVLKENGGKRLSGNVSTLNYLLSFLDAYDFSTESTGDDIQEENKSLINASVLGRIFEKINGYKEGSIFTPGFITMYMSRETIRRAVVQKFNDHLKTSYNDFNELKKEIDISSEGRKKANEIINSLKICDPAVGSGHFHVSALNEIIAIKSELRVLNYRDGSRIQQYKVLIENDELIVSNIETEEIFEYHLNDKENQIDELQKMQEALFHEKETIIENCLFGVDINPNSVNICRLRLWIELLKNAYYYKNPSPNLEEGFRERPESSLRLQTLPNIDINIKQGNSLISRFALDVDLKKALKTFRYTIDDYKNFVSGYRNAKTKEEKRNFASFIDDIKKNFRNEINANDPRRKKLNDLSYELHTKFEAERLIDEEISDAGKKKADKEKEKLIAQINKISEELKSEEHGEIYRNAFEWRFEFPEVLDDNGNFIGFDVVIGNPPYKMIQPHNTSLGIINYMKSIYHSTNFKIDLFHLFFQLGERLLTNEIGLLSYIAPSSLLNNVYVKDLREWMLRSFIIRNVFVSKDQFFDDADIHTAIYLLQKSKNENLLMKNLIETSINFESFFEGKIELQFIQQYRWFKSNDFIFNLNLLGLSANIIDKINTGSVLLKDIAKINRGLITGDKNKYFVDEKLTKEHHPIIQGADVNRYFLNDATKYIIFSRPNTAGGSWDYNVHFSKHKIVIRQIGEKPTATIVDFPICFTGNIFSIISDSFEKDKFLCALLNSNLIYFYWRIMFADFKTSFPQVTISSLNTLPIKINSETHESQITILVEKILTKKKENPETDTTAEEKAIDRLVYELYGLTEEEIEIVEKA